MKTRIVLLNIMFFLAGTAIAGEGMWIPSKIEQGLIERMRAAGSSLTAAEIYSDTSASLKDAVVWFGRGCTGEIISDQGLLLTNYHCGYGQIQSLSTIEKDYLKNGYWAKEMNDELPCKGLSVTFVVSIVEVTTSMISGLETVNDEDEREVIVTTRSDSIVEAETKGTHYDGFVKSYYYGNRYFFFKTEKYTDVRFVGAPPSDIGKFGGDTDNWVWPRHTGDIALFRVYAGPDNKPASYSKDNQPLKPRYSFPISISGVKEGDFTMVYGFPGRTSQYITSEAVRLIENRSNPAKVNIRGHKLAIMDKAIQSNDTIRLKYVSKQARVANAYKKWQGEMLGTSRVNTLGRKQQEETNFEKWAGEQKSEDYKGLTGELNRHYIKLAPYHLAYDYTREAIWGVETLSLIKKYFKLEKKVLADKKASKSLNSEKGRFTKTVNGHFKNFDVRIDQAMFASLMGLVRDSMDQDFRPDFINDIPVNAEELEKFTAESFNNSVFTNQEKLLSTIRGLDHKSARMIQGDPLYKIAMSTYEFDRDQIQPDRSIIRDSIALLMRSYMAGILEMKGEEATYPDANSSMRISFGNVQGVEPRDGIAYKHFTTLGGIIEKEIPGDSEFNVPSKLKELYLNRDYGKYGPNDTLYVGFIASNHTTGGNSGSPVINGKGELVGTNFDRIWEGTMSDIEFDPERCRNITVDIRYTLFLIDKFAGCSRLIDEMKIVE